MDKDQQRLYIEYWQANREREGRLTNQILSGLPVGLLFAVPVLLILFSARLWYKRADMEANSSMSPVVLIIASALISIFVAVIYKRHQWDMKEQQYLQFKANLGEDITEKPNADKQKPEQ
jgi:membrane protein YdbS with pleckstrin-like domain